MENEPLLTDLIPKRLGTFWLIFIFGIGFIAGLEFCFQKMPLWAEKMNVKSIAAFDVTQHGNLFTWFSSTLWLIAALYAAIIYKLDKEEEDWRKMGDIWIWVALLAMFLSVDRAAGFHLAFRDLMVYATGTQLHDSGTIWWLAIYVILFIMVGSRVLVEMKSYLPACNALFMCGICHIVTVCASTNLIFHEDLAKKMMVLSGSEMLGNLFLVLSFGLFGRRLIIGDPLGYSTWQPGFWRRLAKRFTPTRYHYEDSDYECNYNARQPHYMRGRRKRPVVRSGNEEWLEEGETQYRDRDAPYRRKSRLKKSQKGVFY